MARLCHEDNIAMTPYSALAGGRLSRRPGETSKRLGRRRLRPPQVRSRPESRTKSIIRRVAELADAHGTSDDGGRPRMAHGQSDRPGGGRDQTASYRGHDRRRRTGTHARGMRLPRSALRPARPRRRHGAKHRRRRAKRPRLERGRTDHIGENGHEQRREQPKSTTNSGSKARPLATPPPTRNTNSWPAASSAATCCRATASRRRKRPSSSSPDSPRATSFPPCAATPARH